MKSIDIIVPAFNEEACIEPLYDRLQAAIASLPYRFRIVFIDDGSEDGTAEICARLASVDPRVGFVRLSRNFGHQAALTAGLDISRADAVITMDADLQNPPEKLPDFIRAWERGAQIVSGVREASEERRRVKRAFSSLFYWLLNLISPMRVPANAPDFQLLDAKAVNAICRVRDQGRFLRGIASWVGFHRVEIPYTHATRACGSSKYSVYSMSRLALGAVLGFSRTPLRLATYLGLTVCVVALAFFIYASAAHFVYARAVGALSWLALLIAFLSGVQLLAIGVVGEYVAQTLEQSRGRPLYVIAESRIPRLEPAALEPVELESDTAVKR